MQDAQLQILRHALGIGDDGRGKPYRNHFVTGEGSTDHPACTALVESGHMTRHQGSPLTGGDDLFVVTEAGKKVAQAPPERLTPGQRRYQSYLVADSSLTFGQWLRQQGRANG